MQASQGDLWQKQGPPKQDGWTVLSPPRSEATSLKHIVSNMVTLRLPLPSHSFVGTSGANDGAMLLKL